MRKELFINAALFIMLSAAQTLGDSWPIPQPKKIYSENKQYYIEIIPRKLESQLKFFSDKSKGVEPAGSPNGLKDNYCKGIFYKRNASGEYEKVWEQRLSNEVSPVAVLVSNGGKYVVTFDNWHAIGYGDKRRRDLWPKWSANQKNVVDRLHVGKHDHETAAVCQFSILGW